MATNTNLELWLACNEASSVILIPTGHKPISFKVTNSSYPEKSSVQKENSLSWREGKAIVHKQAEKSPLLKKTSSLPKENLASTTRLLYSAQFGGSWLYILALAQEMKVEGFSGATSALKLTRTQAMKCCSGKLREARRRARGRTKQAVTEHFILLLKLLITSDVQSSTISCSEVTGPSRWINQRHHSTWP